jgi:carbon-monoxide dehydrogenase large subunit
VLAADPSLQGPVEGCGLEALAGRQFDLIVNGTAAGLQDGVPKNPNFTDYRIATTVDTPLELESIIVEVPQDDGPFGARGIGEHPMVPTAPAVANAVYNAVGVRVDSLPISSEKVWLALHK